MQKISLNEFYNNLSVSEEFSVAWQLLKKVILSFLLIYLYYFLIASLVFGISRFLVFIVYMLAVYLRYYIVIKAMNGNFSVIKFSEIKNVMQYLLMFGLRVFIFFIITFFINSTFTDLLKLFYNDNNIVLLLLGLIILLSLLSFLTFIQDFICFFLVSSPTATFRQAFDNLLKFVRQNYKSFQRCFLVVFGISVLLLFIGCGLAFFYFSVKGGAIKSVGFYLGGVFYFFLVVLVLLFASTYITTYIGVIFKKYEAKNNLAQLEVIS